MLSFCRNSIFSPPRSSVVTWLCPLGTCLGWPSTSSGSSFRAPAVSSRCHTLIVVAPGQSGLAVKVPFGLSPPSSLHRAHPCARCRSSPLALTKTSSLDCKCQVLWTSPSGLVNALLRFPKQAREVQARETGGGQPISRGPL